MAYEYVKYTFERSTKLAEVYYTIAKRQACVSEIASEIRTSINTVRVCINRLHTDHKVYIAYYRKQGNKQVAVWKAGNGKDAEKQTAEELREAKNKRIKGKRDRLKNVKEFKSWDTWYSQAMNGK